jgi:hypothetical protein
MKTLELYNKIKELGINAEMISMFSYRINKDKRFNTIEVFEAPSIELIELCNYYNCKLMANILNKKNEYGEFDQVVVYEVYPINLNDIEFV